MVSEILQAPSDTVITQKKGYPKYQSTGVLISP